MGLVRISNARKVRKLAQRVGAPVIAAYSRWFQQQNTLLVFTEPRVAWVVPLEGEPERYTEDVELVPHMDSFCIRTNDRKPS